MANKTSFFEALQGYFIQPEKKSLHKLTPDKHRELAEYDYLERLLQQASAPHNIEPEDIVGVAFGTTLHREGVQLRNLYLTQRGWRESRQVETEKDYKDLIGQVMIKQAIFLPIVERGGLEPLLERFNKNPVEFVDLGGKDNVKRILVVYSCDIRDYQRVEDITK